MYVFVMPIKLSELKLIEKQSERARERQSERARERQSERARERQSERAIERERGLTYFHTWIRH